MADVFTNPLGALGTRCLTVTLHRTAPQRPNEQTTGKCHANDKASVRNLTGWQITGINLCASASRRPGSSRLRPAWLPVVPRGGQKVCKGVSLTPQHLQAASSRPVLSAMPDGETEIAVGYVVALKSRLAGAASGGSALWNAPLRAAPSTSGSSPGPYGRPGGSSGGNLSSWTVATACSKPSVTSRPIQCPVMRCFCREQARK